MCKQYSGPPIEASVSSTLESQPVELVGQRARVSGPTSTSQSADDDEGLRGTGWGEGGPVYLET